MLLVSIGPSQYRYSVRVQYSETGGGSGLVKAPKARPIGAGCLTANMHVRARAGPLLRLVR